MLRLRAFRPTSDKIVKIQMHPTHPWLVTADASDHVSVWNWEHRQVLNFFFFKLKKSQLGLANCDGLVFWIEPLHCNWSGNMCVSQVIYELKGGGVDERRVVGAKLEKLAEGESGSYIAYSF